MLNETTKVMVGEGKLNNKEIRERERESGT